MKNGWFRATSILGNLHVTLPLERIWIHLDPSGEKPIQTESTLSWVVVGDESSIIRLWWRRWKSLGEKWSIRRLEFEEFEQLWSFLGWANYVRCCSKKKSCCKSNTFQTIPGLQFWFSNVWERGFIQAKGPTGKWRKQNVYKATSLNINAYRFGIHNMYNTNMKLRYACLCVTCSRWGAVLASHQVMCKPYHDHQNSHSYLGPSKPKYQVVFYPISPPNSPQN